MLRIEPVRLALWDAGVGFNVCHSWYVAWRQDMACAGIAARWLSARANGRALPALMRHVADKGRLDVATALLASSGWDEANCNKQLLQWAFNGRSELCHMLLTR